MALKVCVHNYPSISRETTALERIRSLRNSSPWIQKSLGEFVIPGKEVNDKHKCFVLEPLSLSLAHFHHMFEGGKWTLELVRLVAHDVFHALKSLHKDAKLIHCGT